MATIRKHGKKWQARVRVVGYPTRVKSFSLKSEAKAWADRTEVDIRGGNYTQIDRRTLADAVDRYIRDILPDLREHSRGQQLLWWKERLGPQFMDSIQTSQIVELRDQLRTDGKSSTTCNHYVKALRRLFSIARTEWQYVSQNPCERIKKLREPAGRDRVLSMEEQQRLLHQTQHHSFLHTAVTLALATSARQAEVWNLAWSQVDFAQRHIILRITKNDKPRIILLRGKALELLADLHSNRRLDTDFVFHNKIGNKPLDMRTAWKTALRNANIADFRWHDLRHTAITRMAEAGASLMELQVFSGHSTSEMVRRYAHLTENRIGGKVEEMVRHSLG